MSWNKLQQLNLHNLPQGGQNAFGAPAAPLPPPIPVQQTFGQPGFQPPMPSAPGNPVPPPMPALPGHAVPQPLPQNNGFPQQNNFAQNNMFGGNPLNRPPAASVQPTPFNNHAGAQPALPQMPPMPPKMGGWG